MAKLGEVCTIVSGSTPKTSVTSYWDGNIKWITPAELNEDTFYIMDSVRHITEEGKEKTGLSYLPTGTVILSSRAPIGKTAIAGCKMCCNQGFKNLICSDAIYNEYLYFFLKSKTDYLNSLGRGATFKEISKSIVENIEIPLPEVNQQKEIAEKFKKLEQLISLRKQQLAKLDELVKARFVEMFGDPVYNEMHWETKRLIDICRTIVDCPHSTPHYTTKDTGYKCIRTSAVKKNKILWEKVECISKQEYEERIKRKRPEKGDVIYTREGAILGIAAVIDRDYNVALGQRSMLLSPDIYKCTPCFLSMAMNFDSFLGKALGGVSGSASPHINVGDIKALEIIAPPSEIQNQFSTFVEQVDQQKQTVQQSLEKLELLKKALMQEYFG